MIYLLIFTIPAAIFALYKFPFWEAARDKKAFDANGSADSLKESFHFWRGVRRGVLQGAVVALAAGPLLTVGFKPWALAAGALGVGSLTWFFVTFNVELSKLRGLDPYYISSDPRAAFFPDRYVYRHAFNVAPIEASGAYVSSLARKSFKALLTVILWAGLAACLALAVAAVVVAARA